MRRRATNALPGLVTAFFQDHLKSVRGASPHTVRAYADALRLYLAFLADLRERPVSPEMAWPTFSPSTSVKRRPTSPDFAGDESRPTFCVTVVPSHSCRPASTSPSSATTLAMRASRQQVATSPQTAIFDARRSMRSGNALGSDPSAPSRGSRNPMCFASWSHSDTPSYLERVAPESIVRSC